MIWPFRRRPTTAQTISRLVQIQVATQEMYRHDLLYIYGHETEEKYREATDAWIDVMGGVGGRR